MKAAGWWPAAVAASDLTRHSVRSANLASALLLHLPSKTIQIAIAIVYAFPEYIAAVIDQK